MFRVIGSTIDSFQGASVRHDITGSTGTHVSKRNGKRQPLEIRTVEINPGDESVHGIGIENPVEWPVELAFRWCVGHDGGRPQCPVPGPESPGLGYAATSDGKVIPKDVNNIEGGSIIKLKYIIPVHGGLET